MTPGNETIELQLIADHVPALISYVDAEQRYRYANARYREWFGLESEAILGKHVRDLLGPENYATVRPHVEAALSGEIVTYETRLSFSRHGERWLSIRYVPDVADGHVRGLFTFVTDVTDQRQACQVLRNSEENFRSLLRAVVETAADGVITIDEHGTVETMNSAAEKIFGYAAEDVCGRNVTSLMPAPFAAEHDEHLARYRSTGERKVIGVGREVVGRRRDGTTFPMEISVSEFRLDGRRAFAGIVRDISERRRAEERLQESERRFRAVFEQGPQLSSILSRDGKVLEANQTALTLSGLERADVIGRPFWETRWWSHSRALQSKLREGIATAARGKPVRFEATHPRADGTFATIDFSLRPVTDDDGRVLFLLPESLDVSEKKRLEREFLQAQKMEAVGRLAGGIAHDFNNLLMGVLGCCRIAVNHLGDTHPARALIEDIGTEAERAVGLTRQLLAFSRERKIAPRSIELNRVVEDARKMIGRLVGEDIAINVELAVSGAPIVADPAQIEQVLMNLVVNARDAMPRGGELRIATADVASHDGNPHAAPNPGRHITLAVQDTGVGMDEETQAKIFEPFFTTKRPGEGTGLGLSTAYAIVEQLGGRIGVESAPGHGTTLTVVFPRDETASRAASPERPEAVPAGGEETVLLVEDEGLVRASVRYALESRGYRVLEAKDAEDALRVIAERDRRIDLLLTDIVLPGLSGPELAKRIDSARQGVATLFMSAYPKDYLVEQGRLGGGEFSLEKPFTDDVLAASVREVLDARAG